MLLLNFFLFKELGRGESCEVRIAEFFFFFIIDIYIIYVLLTKCIINKIIANVSELGLEYREKG